MKSITKMLSLVLITVLVVTSSPVTLFAKYKVPDVPKQQSGVSGIGGKYAGGAVVDYNSYTDYADGNKLLDGSKGNYSSYFKSHRMWYQGGIKPQAVEKTTDSGDYAIQILTGSSTAFPFGEKWEGTPGTGENYAHGIKLFETRNGCAWKSTGTYVQEFDLWVNTNNDLLALRGMNLWGNAMSSSVDPNYNWHILDENGHIRGTEVDYPVKTWFSLKLAYTYPENTWNVYIKNTVDAPVWTEISLPSDGLANSESSKYYIDGDITTISFILAQLDGTVGDKAGFKIDNYRIYTESDVIDPLLSEFNVSSDGSDVKVSVKLDASEISSAYPPLVIAVAYDNNGDLKAVATEKSIQSSPNVTLTLPACVGSSYSAALFIFESPEGNTPQYFAASIYKNLILP